MHIESLKLKLMYIGFFELLGLLTSRTSPINVFESLGIFMNFLGPRNGRENQGQGQGRLFIFILEFEMGRRRVVLVEGGEGKRKKRW